MLSWLWRIVYRSWMRFSDDDGWAIASHIALSGLTSLFPFLILVGALAGFIGTPDLAQRATNLLFESWPPQVAGPIAREVENVLTQPRTGVATLSALLAVYFASSAVDAVRIGLNRAYDETDGRAWWVLRLESVLFVLLGAVALMGFTFLVVLEPIVWAAAVRFLPHLADLQGLFDAVRLATISLILVATLVFAHKFLAAGRRRLAQIAPGVALTLLLWLAFGEGFGFYLARFSQNYVTTYAGLASVMIALVFLYVLSAIFIFGGEVNASISATRQRKTGAQEVPRAGD
ncbi:MAG TPA: YihY/virulence factor BrkB family protein [Beijerinckiaceae bacterium]|nr:YihY/virulence factor BrkB family protein [Rhodoblastus sp.]MCB9997721.1 YihY/virulence factor BrkB family protein [Methylobacteriaceae bacterium]MCC2101669.1 YihY/virulence factor BrkB family protein [Hyphomicrobiales bacterium]HRY04735.1 YihY/virulence factor BrkB family protein [Beijerinckiaceae bacterium]MCO5089103.1 YihY/virulence factor BrkB family protein [Methylobacteriaceae bacterium]